MFFNLIKVLSWFETDLQMLSKIWWLKFSLTAISIPKSLTFDNALIYLDLYL